MKATIKKVAITILAAAALICAVAIPRHMVPQNTLYDHPAQKQLALFYHNHY